MLEIGKFAMCYQYVLSSYDDRGVRENRTLYQKLIKSIHYGDSEDFQETNLGLHSSI